MAKAKPTSPAQSPDRQELRRHFDSVFAEINAFLAEEEEQKREELREQMEPLCFMKLIEHKIQIAWGGPEYGFKLYFDPESKDWIRGLFYWADWFKYEEEPLSTEELDRVIEAYAMEYMVE